MAPPTGPRNSATTTNTRTTRSSRGGSNAPSRGGTSRGGIRKRDSAGPARVDRDGDMVMDSQPTKPPTGPRGGAKTRGTTRGGRARNAAITSHKLQRQIGASDTDLAARIAQGTRRLGGRNNKIMKVTGLGASKAATNTDRGLKSVTEFLERKSLNVGKGLTIIKSYVDDDHNLFLMVKEDDVPEVMKLDSFVFAGSTLNITESDEPWPVKPTTSKLSQESLQRKEQLRQVLINRYDEPKKLLNLSELGNDPILVEMGFLESKELAEKTFKVLMAICDEYFPTSEAKRNAVAGITLAGNTISQVTWVNDVALTFPKLLYLDIRNNDLKDLKALAPWRHRFRELESIYVNGNPLQQNEPNYKTEITKWFPYLHEIDGDKVRDPAEVAKEKEAAAAGPQPIPQAGPDFRDVAQIGEQFVRLFFPGYDSDRNQLLALLYDDASTFSLSVNTNTPRKESDPPVAPWAAYIKHSRNLSKITGIGPRMARLIKGGEKIKEIWSDLPATRHPDLSTEVNKYIIDCHPMAGIPDPAKQSKNGVDGLIISVHGEFDESGPNNKINKRSFTRTFVLGPGVPGKNEIRVINDMLSLRAPASVPQQAPTTAPEPTPEVQQQMIEEFSKRTMLKPDFSRMCLAEVGWNFDEAGVRFTEARPNLGPEMFMGAQTL